MKTALAIAARLGQVWKPYVAAAFAAATLAIIVALLGGLLQRWVEPFDLVHQLAYVAVVGLGTVVFMVVVVLGLAVVSPRLFARAVLLPVQFLASYFVRHRD